MTFFVTYDVDSLYGSGTNSTKIDFTRPENDKTNPYRAGQENPDRKTAQKSSDINNNLELYCFRCGRRYLKCPETYRYNSGFIGKNEPCNTDRLKTKAR